MVRFKLPKQYIVTHCQVALVDAAQESASPALVASPAPPPAPPVETDAPAAPVSFFGMGAGMGNDAAFPASDFDNLMAPPEPRVLPEVTPEAETPQASVEAAAFDEISDAFDNQVRLDDHDTEEEVEEAPGRIILTILSQWCLLRLCE